MKIYIVMLIYYVVAGLPLSDTFEGLCKVKKIREAYARFQK